MQPIVKLYSLPKRCHEFVKRKDIDKGNPGQSAKDHDEVEVTRNGDTIEVRKAQGNKLIMSLTKSESGLQANSQWMMLYKMTGA